MAEAEQDRAVLPPRGAGIPAEIGEKFWAFKHSSYFVLSQSSADLV